jgi:hypothetical protein
MAFIRDYEIQGSGATIPNAYHVVTGVNVKKRNNDIMPPVDVSQPSGYTSRGDDEPEVYWRSGYIANVTVTIWASRQARIDDLNPIGWMGVEPTETEMEENIGTPDMNGKCVFFLDMDSSDSYVTQAYNHLRSLAYYANAEIDDDPVSTDDDEFANSATANT